MNQRKWPLLFYALFLISLSCGKSEDGEDGETDEIKTNEIKTTTTTESESPNIQGLWLGPIESLGNISCGSLFNFHEDNYAELFLCFSSTKSNIDLREGKFELNESTIIFKPNRNSCQTKSLDGYSAPYSLSGNNLSLSYAGGKINFVRDTSTATSEGSSGSISSYGCFEKDGSFVANTNFVP
jgi:hypothetical protein